MASAVNVGDNVWVPVRRLGIEAEQPFALVQRLVLGKNSRTVTVDVLDGATTNIAS
jgi:hypothetical protein